MRVTWNLDPFRDQFDQSGLVFAPSLFLGRQGGAFLVTLVALYINPVLSTQEFSSDIGAQRRVALSDGSSVLLNTSTSVVFENRLRSRDAHLRKGEALFSVLHSGLRPFEVTTRNVTVRDVGTIFSVRSDSDDVTVAVVEGQVELSSADQKVILSDDQAATIDASHLISRSDAQFQALVNWRNQRLEFKRTPLMLVVREIQRYSRRAISFEDVRVQGYRVTGGFSSADPDLLLKTLGSVRI
ncbi:Iron siderophore sensor protein [Candidatus Burkholderia verschuerenii]|uniref:Iron siderophore sensor protein n=1 Tax=Candidatus Burkholderia verschuerenii TaxID=242163 RepID=A0A0L0M5W2_9BURK|nr:FecR domain-containing protein [Candidatus Burkholderia verschuerenii]KND57665.1 Iron siderophore sensor protein [Candidatus Burkholderia verschuerenii]